MAFPEMAFPKIGSSVLETLSSYESSSKMPTPPVNILPTQLSTSPLSGNRKRARSLDEPLQQARQTYAILSPEGDTSFFQNTQDVYLHLQQDDVASSIQSVSTDSSDIKELLIKISSDMGKILSEMDKMSFEIDMIKNKLDDIEDKVELSNILISTVI
ncbi:hypothetical protein CAJAP_00815 [Camponotus japonicus]